MLKVAFFILFLTLKVMLPVFNQSVRVAQVKVLVTISNVGVSVVGWGNDSRTLTGESPAPAWCPAVQSTSDTVYMEVVLSHRLRT